MVRVALGLFVMLGLESGANAQQAPGAPPTANNITLEMLAREGYEIKAMHSATTRGVGFMVMLQRGADVRSCLLRVTRGSDGRPARQSVCF